MTIRTGESYVIESRKQFHKRLNVDEEEAIQALPDDLQEEMLAEENQIRNDHDRDPIQDVTGVYSDVLHHFLSKRGLNQHILDVLAARDREYTHIYDGAVHRIIELNPPEDSIEENS